MKTARTVLVFLALAVVQSMASATDITDYAVYGAGKVKVNDTVFGDVGSHDGSLYLGGRATVFGDAVAADGLSVSSRSVLFGDATAGGEVKVKGRARVKGTVTSWASPGVLDPLLADGLLPVTSFSSGGTTYKGKYGTLDLDPGQYGDLKVKGAKGGGELHLASGDYYFDSFALKRTTLVLDVSEGAINIYVQDKLKVAKSGVVFAGVEDGDAYGAELAGLVYLEAHGKGKLANSDWYGTVYDPYARLTVNNTSVIGALYGGGDIRLAGRGTNIIHSPLLVDGLVQPVDDPDDPSAGLGLAPEPGTIALLGSGLIGLMARGFSRKRRRA